MSSNHTKQTTSLEVFQPNTTQWNSSVGKHVLALAKKLCFKVTHPKIDGVTIPMRPDIDFMTLNEARLDKVYERLVDADSKECFAYLIAAAVYNNPRFYHNAISSYRQYWHPAAIAQKGDVILDLGAFDGVSAVDYLVELDGNAEVIAMEPGKDNYDYILKNIESFHYKDKIQVINQGSWSKKKKMYFSYDVVHPGASVVEKGTKYSRYEIDVTDVDSLVQELKLEKVSLIKMDIEGAELESLKGVTEVIKKYKPKLQISIYHKPEDYWEISNFIENLGLGYKQYLGHHYFGFWESVLYASTTEI